MKKIFILFALLLVFSCLFSGCKKKMDIPEITSSEMQLRGPSPGDTIAIFDTNLGVFKAVLYPEFAPRAVENFTTHARDKYYDGVTFHRVIQDFVVQSGDPTHTGSGGDSIWMIPFENEVSEELHHYRGALGMANAGPDQNKSQFYVVAGGRITEDAVSAMKNSGWTQSVVDAYSKEGGQPGLDYHYTVFGQVYDGLDIIDAIAAVKVNSKDNRPLEDVLVNSITIDTYKNPIQ